MRASENHFSVERFTVISRPTKSPPIDRLVIRCFKVHSKQMDINESRPKRAVLAFLDIFLHSRALNLFPQVFCTATLGSLRSAKQSDATAEGVG